MVWYKPPGLILAEFRTTLSGARFSTALLGYLNILLSVYYFLAVCEGREVGSPPSSIPPYPIECPYN